MAGIVDRVAVASTEVRPVRVLLTVLVFPLLVLGFVAGLLFVLVRYVFGALKVGFAEAAKYAPKRPDVGSPGAG